MKRGDVVLVPFPFQDKRGEKIRPAVVVQSDSETARLINTIVAMITGNTDDAGHPTTLLVDPSTPEGAGRVAQVVTAATCPRGRGHGLGHAPGRRHAHADVGMPPDHLCLL